MSGIVLKSVRKEFPGGVVAVRDIDLVVERGEFVALVGPSGCGKTTTLRMVAGLEETSSGRVEINGRDVTHLPPRKRDVAMVFQNYALYAHMTVRRNMAFGLRMAKTAKPEIDRRVSEAAKMLGIVRLLDRKPKALSGGERQRVAMGRAIVREPAAFLMDEPLSNLDAKLRVEMRAEIINVQRRLGVPTLYVTHDQVEAMTMGDRVAILRDGELQQLGSPAELYDRPVNVFVATFIGSPAMNLITGQLEKVDDRLELRLCGSRMPLPPEVDRLWPGLSEYRGREVIVGVRPEDFRAAANGSADGDGLVPAEIVRAESLGAESIVYFRANGHDPAAPPAPEDQPEAMRSIRDQVAAVTAGMLTARLGRGASVPHGGRAQLAVDLKRLYFFDPKTGTALAG